MCIDPGTLAVVTAIGSAASGAIGSIASYTQQQQEANYQNALAQQQYQSQMAAYQRSEQAYQEQIRLNLDAANRAYTSKQAELATEFRKATEEAQKLSVKSLQQQGTVLASGRTGQSLGVLMTDAERMFGRDYALLGQNLAYATQDYYTGADTIFNQTQSQQNIAASQRMMEPSAPIPIPGPSGIGLVAGLGGSVIGGLSTFASLKAPKATSSSPAPRPIPVPGQSTPNKTVIKWG
jgi:ubiquitin